MSKLSDLEVAMKTAAMDAQVMAVAKAFHQRALNRGCAFYSWNDMQPEYRANLCEIVRFTLERTA